MHAEPHVFKFAFCSVEVFDNKQTDPYCTADPCTFGIAQEDQR